MNEPDVIQWYKKADNDYEAAYFLNSDYKKKTDIICYLCSQSVEKYLKGFLVFHNQEFEKKHNLNVLNDLCISYDKKFENIRDDCKSLNKYSTETRYPNGRDTTITDSNFCLKTVDKIVKFLPLQELRKALKIKPVEHQ